MSHLVDTARDLVTSKDEFLCSILGIECVVLESLYLANSGNLRRAWLVCRRAMVGAQLMGLHRSRVQQPPHVVDPSQPVDTAFIWFRIVCTDRQLSLLLGLPQGSLDISMATEAALATDSPSGRFERRQCVIASRILARNESSDVGTSDDFAAVLQLDAELQSAANDMPSKWWLVPNLASELHDLGRTFWETLRLLDQMLYFNLLNLLHLPYMLQSNSANIEQTGKKSDREYSKLASINASRELLARFIMFRSFNRVAYSCRAVDLFALTAAMTLVIAHLDRHCKQQQRQNETDMVGATVLAHQRNGDRAMMEKVLDSMEGVARLNTDTLSERSSALLKSLLALEADAVEGRSTASETDDGHFLRLGIPYFGTVRISSAGVVVSMEAPPNDTADQIDASLQISGLQMIPSMQSSIDDMGTISTPEQTRHISQAPSLASPLTESSTHQSLMQQFPTVINDVLHQQYLYPGLTTSADDWAFQGVDTVFFDSLIRGSGGESIGDADSS